MCALPPPSDLSYWPARVGHIQACAELALGMLRRGNPEAARKILEDALKIEADSDEAFHAHLTRTLQAIRR